MRLRCTSNSPGTAASSKSSLPRVCFSLGVDSTVIRERDILGFLYNAQNNEQSEIVDAFTKCAQCVSYFFCFKLPPVFFGVGPGRFFWNASTSERLISVLPKASRVVNRPFATKRAM